VSPGPCQSPARVAVATGNTAKLRAAERALKRLCNVASVDAAEPPAGLPPQPVGSQVFWGALRRALSALGAGADLGVGVEAGPLEFYTGTGFIEVQVAVVAGPGGRVSVGLSQGFELPPGIAEKVTSGVELGSLAKGPGGRDIGESIGYIGLLTGGYITRSDLTEHAVAMALVPWTAGWWTTLPRAEDLEKAYGGPPR